jgi:hypothetical protein
MPDADMVTATESPALTLAVLVPLTENATPSLAPAKAMPHSASKMAIASGMALHTLLRIIASPISTLDFTISPLDHHE